MNIPNRASRHQAMRESRWAGVSGDWTCMIAARTTRWQSDIHLRGLGEVEEVGEVRTSNLFASRCPPLAVRQRVPRQTLGLHRDAVARRGGRHVMAVANHDGVHKILVQVIHVLDDAILE